MARASDYVHLRGAPGVVVPLAALRLLWSLEERGFALSPQGDRLLVVPGAELTEVDREQIRRWKSHLLALMTYTPGDLHDPAKVGPLPGQSGRGDDVRHKSN